MDGALVVEITGEIDHQTAPVLEQALPTAVDQAPLRIVVDSNRPMIRPMQVMNLDDELRLYHTVEDALHAANQQPRP